MTIDVDHTTKGANALNHRFNTVDHDLNKVDFAVCVGDGGGHDISWRIGGFEGELKDVLFVRFCDLRILIDHSGTGHVGDGEVEMWQGGLATWVRGDFNLEVQLFFVEIDSSVAWDVTLFSNEFNGRFLGHDVVDDLLCATCKEHQSDNASHSKE